MRQSCLIFGAIFILKPQSRKVSVPGSLAHTANVTPSLSSNCSNYSKSRPHNCDLVIMTNVKVLFMQQLRFALIKRVHCLPGAKQTDLDLRGNISWFNRADKSVPCHETLSVLPSCLMADGSQSSGFSWQLLQDSSTLLHTITFLWRGAKWVHVPFMSFSKQPPGGRQAKGKVHVKASYCKRAVFAVVFLLGFHILEVYLIEPLCGGRVCETTSNFVCDRKTLIYSTMTPEVQSCQWFWSAACYNIKHFLINKKV